MFVSMDYRIESVIYDAFLHVVYTVVTAEIIR